MKARLMAAEVVKFAGRQKHCQRLWEPSKDFAERVCMLELSRRCPAKFP